ncbi:MAG: hypothetical protein ACO1NS_11455 [Daejeonella sp.]
MELIKNIKGSGVNTMTEIMMTYNFSDFANLNSNPITVLKQEGGVKLKTSRDSFNGVEYEEYCELVKEIREHFHLKSMLEADSFFNDIYWILKKHKKT